MVGVAQDYIAGLDAGLDLHETLLFLPGDGACESLPEFIISRRRARISEMLVGDYSRCGRA